MLVWGQGIPPTHSINVADLTDKQKIQLLTSSVVCTERRTHYLPDAERICYVLCNHIRGLHVLYYYYSELSVLVVFWHIHSHNLQLGDKLEILTFFVICYAFYILTNCIRNHHTEFEINGTILLYHIYLPSVLKSLFYSAIKG